jgi:hypothetical protein
MTPREKIRRLIRIDKSLYDMVRDHPIFDDRPCQCDLCRASFLVYETIREIERPGLRTYAKKEATS